MSSCRPCADPVNEINAPFLNFAVARYSVRVNRRRGRDWNKRDGSCAICLELLSTPVNGSLRVEALVENANPLLCNHIFHRRCLENVISRGRLTCPVCNLAMDEDVIVRLGGDLPEHSNGVRVRLRNLQREIFFDQNGQRLATKYDDHYNIHRNGRVVYQKRFSTLYPTEEFFYRGGLRVAAFQLTEPRRIRFFHNDAEYRILEFDGSQEIFEDGELTHRILRNGTVETILRGQMVKRQLSDVIDNGRITFLDEDADAEEVANRDAYLALCEDRNQGIDAIVLGIRPRVEAVEGRLPQLLREGWE